MLPSPSAHLSPAQIMKKKIAEIKRSNQTLIDETKLEMKTRDPRVQNPGRSHQLCMKFDAMKCYMIGTQHCKENRFNFTWHAPLKPENKLGQNNSSN